MWPFGKKSDEDKQDIQPEDTTAAEVTTEADVEEDAVPADAREAMMGPFDSHDVDVDELNFSDFASGFVDLGSMHIPLPHEAQVQVEMGETGPKLVHFVTEAGRITPVAFAAPTSGGLWDEVKNEIITGFQQDQLEVSVERGPWGDEIVGVAPNAVMRVIAAEGPRWMMRLVVAGPSETAAQLHKTAHGILARTVVTRSDSPIPAGQSLPVVLPAPMVESLKEAIQAREAELAQQNNPEAGNSAE